MSALVSVASVDEGHSETNDPFEMTLDERLFTFLERLDAPNRTQSLLTRGVVSSEERAEQLALDAAQCHGFHDGIDVLIQAMQVSRHPRTRAAIETLLQNHVTPDELRIVLELRERWREHPEFSVALRGAFSVGGRRREFLPYQLALRLSRLFAYGADTDEVLEYIQQCLTLWRDREDLLRRFSVFQWFLAEMADQQRPIQLYAEVSCDYWEH